MKFIPFTKDKVRKNVPTKTDNPKSLQISAMPENVKDNYFKML